jgi:hypothetical protein
MRKIGLTLAAAFALAAASGGTANAKPPSLCDDMMEPAMQHYQIFSEEIQQYVDAAGHVVCH